MKFTKQLIPGSLTFFVFFYAFVLMLVGKQVEMIENSRIQFYTKEEQAEIYSQKPYNNDYYHFAFKIPKDWSVSESEKENGVINFVLSSPDSQLIIQDTPPEGFKHNRGNYPNGYPVGLYSATRTSERVNDKSVTRLDVSETYLKAVPLYLISPDSNLEENKILNSILSSFRYTKQEPTIRELISYDLPEDWSEDYNMEFDTLTLRTNDYTATYAVIPELTGLSVSIRKHLRQVDETYETIKQRAKEPKLGHIEIIEESLVDGKIALFIFASYEGTRLGYSLIANNDVWNITIMCDRCDTVEQYLASAYRTVVDQFIDSIRFNYD